MRFLTTVLVDTLVFVALSGFFPANFYVTSVWDSSHRRACPGSLKLGGKANYYHFVTSN